MQPNKWIEEESKSWFELGNVMGLEVVHNEEQDVWEGQSQEDKEVEMIIERGKETKSWFELGNVMGLEVVHNEEQDVQEGQSQEDKEVEMIIERGNETKSKII